MCNGKQWNPGPKFRHVWDSSASLVEIRLKYQQQDNPNHYENTHLILSASYDHLQLCEKYKLQVIFGQLILHLVCPKVIEMLIRTRSNGMSGKFLAVLHETNFYLA